MPRPRKYDFGCIERAPVYAYIEDPTPMQLAADAADAYEHERHESMDMIVTRKYSKDRRRKFAIDPVVRARYAQICRLILSDNLTDREAIARHVGITKNLLQTHMDDPQFAVIFNELLTDVYSSIDKTLACEASEPVIRQRAIYIRSQTLLSETIELLRDRIGMDSAGERRMGAGEIRAAIDASKTAYEQSGMAAQPGQGNASNVTPFRPNKIQANNMKDAIQESGLDMSDVLADIVDVEPEEVEVQ